MSTQGNKLQIKKILDDPHCAGTIMVALCFDLFGEQFLEWDPQILRDALVAATGHELSDAQNDRLHSAIAMLTTDKFENDWLFYAHACEALGGTAVDTEVRPNPTPEDMAWASAEFELLTGEAPKFSDEILAFQGACLQDHGLHHVPNTLAGAVLEESPETGLENDPEMYHGWATKELRLVEQVDEHVKGRIAHLLKALDEIPLDNRDNKSWVALMQQAASNHP